MSAVSRAGATHRKRARSPSRIRWITVTVGGTALPMVVHRGETIAELLVAVAIAFGVAVDGLELYAGNDRLPPDGPIWDLLADGHTVTAVHANNPSGNDEANAPPAAQRCPGCWNQ